MNTTRSAEIRDQLRSEILSLKLAPGSELNPKEIAQRMLVSMSPVRDALQALRAEGLVEIWPQSGTRVSKIDLSQMEVEHVLRSTLEREVADRFARHPDEHALRQMEFFLEEQRWAASQEKYPRFLEVDDKFHEKIFQATGFGRLWSIIQSHVGNYQRIRLLSFTDKDVVIKVLESHKAILEALRSGDREKVDRLEKNHLGHLDVEKYDLLERFPGYFTQTTIKE